jgi:hypothetical protein
MSLPEPALVHAADAAERGKVIFRVANSATTG